MGGRNQIPVPLFRHFSELRRGVTHQFQCFGVDLFQLRVLRFFDDLAGFIRNHQLRLSDDVDVTDPFLDLLSDIEISP